jgi:alkylation response protein AidB-like acyl-CoA dehydrogenase
MLDRVLVVAAPESEDPPVLAEVALDQAGIWPDPNSWQADGMAASDTLDVAFAAAEVDRLIGGPGWYTERPGFRAGGGGVAAVWWGGAAGLLDRTFAHARRAKTDPHMLAHLGELHALLAASHALLRATADELDAAPQADHTLALASVRSAVEHSCRETVDRVPRILGPGSWSGDRELAGQLADLQMYVRQHHGERDNAALAAALIQERGR